MRERGFSLVEVLVVVLVLTTLCTISTLKFSEYIRRSKKESQIRTMHGEIMQARLHSLTERRGRHVAFSRNTFEVYSSDVKVDKGAEPQLRLTLQYPITWNRGADSYISIDDRGVIDANSQCSICLEDVGDKALLDSVVVSRTRVNLGSRDDDGVCESSGITVR